MKKDRTSGASRIVWGVLFLALGTVLMLERTHFLVVGSIWRFWPVGMIGMGLGKLVQHQGIEGLQSGLWLVVLGGWFLVVNFGILGLTIKSSWPMLAVAFGAYLIWQALMPARTKVEAGQEVRHDQ